MSKLATNTWAEEIEEELERMQKEINELFPNNEKKELESRTAAIERNRRDVDEFIESLAKRPTRIVPGAKPDLCSFSHDAELRSFIQRKRQEELYFDVEEVAAASCKYTANVMKRYIEALGI